MAIEFVDYTLLKKRGLIKIRDDAGNKQQRFNFGGDGFVDLGNLTPETQTAVPTPAHSDHPISQGAVTPVQAIESPSPLVPDFLAGLAQVGASTQTPSIEPSHHNTQGVHEKLDDLSRTIQILVDRISELDIKVSKLSGNFK